MLHVPRVGCPWRGLHEWYGKWNSVYGRFRRLGRTGVWNAAPANAGRPEAGTGSI
ncbi:MAG: transposase [Erythrobacter sp.]